MRFRSPPIIAHILLAAQRVDHRPGREEEQRLEERMRHQVEDRRRVRRDAASQEHVAKLRDGRVCQHALDVVLHHADASPQTSLSPRR